MAPHGIQGGHLVRRITCLLVILAVAGCSTNRNVQPMSRNMMSSMDPPPPAPVVTAPDVPDSVAFAVTLAAFRQLPAEVQLARRQAADPHLDASIGYSMNIGNPDVPSDATGLGTHKSSLHCLAYPKTALQSRGCCILRS